MRTEQTVTGGPEVDAAHLTFRFHDPDHRLRGVRLQQEIRIPAEQLDLTWTDGTWQLRVDRPAVDRVEYLFELNHPDGSSEFVPDPANPVQVEGAFGPKSVLELPGYRAPWWLGRPASDGDRREVRMHARELGEDVAATIWSPAGTDDSQPLPLLVVHDGPEFDTFARITTYLSASITSGALPPVRAALLVPGDRNARYSAEGRYTRALALAVVPRLRTEVRTSATVGMGASLGALAMLHAQRQHPDCFDALFLQSGSFFHPRHDAHERRFSQYDRIVRSVASILRAGGHAAPVPTVMTCGTIEENLANNRIMARALAAQGYDVTLREVRDVHNYTAWRDAFDPWLTRLLCEVARARAAG